jgi:hypothetical protein
MYGPAGIPAKRKKQGDFRRKNDTKGMTMTEQMINLSFSMKDIFQLIPDIASSVIRYNPAAAGVADSFKGKEVGLAFDFDGTGYSLLIKDGRDFSVGNGNMEKPMLKVSMTMEDLEKLIKVDNARIFLGKGIDPAAMGGTGKAKQVYDKLSGLKGTIVTELKDKGNNTSRIHFVFNGADMPKAVIRLSMDNFAGIVSKKDNPVNLFMSGQLQIEGDMGLAMNIQTIF